MNNLTIKVLFFGSCREALNRSDFTLYLPPPASVKVAFEALQHKFPELENFGNSLLFAINEEHSQKNDPLHNGDTLAIFPPVSGG